MKYFSVVVLCFLCCSLATPVHAQELTLDVQTVVKARVSNILNEATSTIPGTDTVSAVQTIEVEILEGEEEGTIVTVENDYLNLEKGEVFYLRHTVSKYDGLDYYSVLEPYRLPAVSLYVGLFLLTVLIFGGIQGIRGLVSLAGSLLLIFYVLLPGILQGYSPIVLSVFVASLIVTVGSYITHGFTKTTTTAVLGMIFTVLLTGILAYISVLHTHLSGFSAEESVALNFNTRGSIDFVGLLMGGILIGLLGVLYDAAISQAISVEELHHIAPHLSRSTIYKRALRIGREHIGALINTLAIAYVGASLPLLLLFYTTGADPSILANQEVIASEIIRTAIGSIGVILVVPITTFVATYMLVHPSKRPVSEEELAREHSTLTKYDHHH